ncbi:MAG: hypothetical protein AB1567_08405, partial [bacterium]
MDIDCKYFSGCSAPFCPKEEDKKLKSSLWYPNEEICKVRDYKQLIWIRNQKKIKKVTKGNFEIGYFTIEMLDRR